MLLYFFPPAIMSLNSSWPAIPNIFVCARTVAAEPGAPTRPNKEDDDAEVEDCAGDDVDNDDVDDEDAKDGEE